MIGVINQEFRAQLKDSLQVFSEIIDNPSGNSFSISRLEEIFKLARMVRRESKQIIRKNLDTPLSFASLHMVSCFLLSVAMYHKETGEEPILPPAWLDSTDIPNPNGIFAHLITQLLLLSISVTELIEVGLDSPARALVRSVMELAWQTLILLTFKEDLQNYITPETTEEVNQMWFQLFGRGRTQEKLTKIEKMLNLDQDTLERLRKNRKEDYQYFSESIHHSYPMTMVGTIMWSFEKDEGKWSAFGGASSTSIATIHLLNQTLDYFSQIFIMVLNDVHNIYPNLNNSYWREFIVVREVLDSLKPEIS